MKVGFNGSGVYSPIFDFEADAVSPDHFNVEAARVQGQIDDMATALSNCVLKNGTQTITANLPMNAKKFTDLGDAAALQEAVTFKQIRNGVNFYGTTGGSATAYTLSPSVAIPAYVAGLEVTFIAHAQNTGSATLNISGLGAKTLFSNAEVLVAGMLRTGGMYQAVYDGVQFHLLNASQPAFINFTPALRGTGGNPTVTGGGVEGRWRRLNDKVEGFITFNSMTITGGGGNARIELVGLPSVINSSFFRKQAGISVYGSLLLSSEDSPGAYISEGPGAFIELTTNNNIGVGAMSIAELSASFTLNIDFSYVKE